MSESAAIILAAGKSTRMLSDRPKVVHEICGRPMLHYVVSACILAGVDRLLVVVGHGQDQVKRALEHQKEIVWVEQAQQRGTGHAVLCCHPAFEGYCGSIVVIAGDMPLIRRETLASLIAAREDTGDALAMATGILDDPTGYGRIIRDECGALEAIVEHAECDAQQKEIREVNPSFYCFDAQRLFSVLKQLQPSGGKGELYLTDAVRLFKEAGEGVSADVQVTSEEARGINSRLELALVNRAMQDRIQLALMSEGVTIIDPDNTWMEADVTVGRDTVVYPFSIIRAGATIGENCSIGPFAHIHEGESVPSGTSVGSTATSGATG